MLVCQMLEKDPVPIIIVQVMDLLLCQEGEEFLSK